MYEQWEYLTKFVEANAKKEIKQYLKERWPEEMKKPAKYTPESMIPELNRLGEEGWELINMEPVARVGGKGDVRFENDRWSNVYFCVFKRRKAGAMPVLPVGYPQQQQAAPQQPASPTPPGTPNPSS